MKNLKSFFSFVLLLLLGVSHAQTQGNGPVDVDKRFEEALKAKMEKDRKMIENFMNDDLFKQFDKMFEDMARDFDKGNFEGLQKFFEKGHFDTFLGESGLFDNLDIGQGKWIENPEEKILVLKIARKEEEPLNIEIKEGVIHVSGQVITKQKRIGTNGQIEQTQGERKIDRTFPIPSDVDASHPRFENKDGSIFIRFTRKSIQKNSGTPSQRQPVAPKDGELTI